MWGTDDWFKLTFPHYLFEGRKKKNRDRDLETSVSWISVQMSLPFGMVGREPREGRGGEGNLVSESRMV